MFIKLNNNKFKKEMEFYKTFNRIYVFGSYLTDKKTQMISI